MTGEIKAKLISTLCYKFSRGFHLDNLLFYTSFPVVSVFVAIVSISHLYLLLIIHTCSLGSSSFRNLPYLHIYTPCPPSALALLLAALLLCFYAEL